MNILIHAV